MKSEVQMSKYMDEDNKKGNRKNITMRVMQKIKK